MTPITTEIFLATIEKNQKVKAFRRSVINADDYKFIETGYSSIAAMAKNCVVSGITLEALMIKIKHIQYF